LAAAAILLALILAALAVWMRISGGSLETLPASLRGLFGNASLPEGFAMANGRIEATEVDVAAKLPGRLKEVLVREGDRVQAGQVVAVLDTEALEAELRQAQAELRRAQQEREHALALVEQQESELDFARRDLARLQKLSRSERFVSEEQIDQARTRVQTAEAALRASEVQVLAAEAAIEAARAHIERIQVDIADSTLRAPRGGRVLYRLGSPARCWGRPARC
jgi:HlyD family secretion protein